MNCPKCHAASIKRGFYTRPSDKKIIQRFRCKNCSQSFSTQTTSIDYRFRRRRQNQAIFKLLCSGVSQRRCGLIVSIKPVGIARRVVRFGRVAENNLKNYRSNRAPAADVIFDELETIEHTKCKPLTVPIAVENETRKILSVGVAPIAAKGHLAKISVKKYGLRKCGRKQALTKLLKDLRVCSKANTILRSDQSRHYPHLVKSHFPMGKHVTTKGQRGCVVGQGELKRGGYDPIFSLNHSYAMFRDNLKTLSRRSWCTVKRPEKLLMLLYMYAEFHNQYLDNPRKIVLQGVFMSN